MAATPDQIDAVIRVCNDLVKMQFAAVAHAIEHGPQAGIDLIAERFEDAGVEDDETRLLLDRWWNERNEVEEAVDELLSAALDSLPTQCVNPKEQRLKRAVEKLQYLQR